MTEYRYTLKKFLKDWALIIGMVVGASAYLLYSALPALHPAGPFLESFIKHLQPVLIFIMLFLSFSKIEPRQLRLHHWMHRVLILQCSFFVGLSLLLAFVPGLPLRFFFESLALCVICPTATACAVVTGKLGGNMAGVVTYTVMINVAVAILVPLMVPLVHPAAGVSFLSAFVSILFKVFPLLILPALAAWAVRFLLPRFHAWVLGFPNLAFYIWSVSLSLAILMSTRAIVHNSSGASVLFQVFAASVLACVLQFWAGRRIGRKFACPVSAGQAFGQKNTVFGMWMGYTFFSGVTSVAEGFYSIWHNCYNTWQMYRKRKRKENN